MKNICLTCQHENRTENRFCTQCGTKLDSPGPPVSRLVVLNDDEKPIVFTLHDTRNTIGRDVENSFVINDDQISRQHAAIFFDQGLYWIEDLQSKNGVFLNGSRIFGRERLHEGSLVKLGSTILRFESSQ